MDPIDTLPMRAATDDAATHGAVVVVPKDLNGPVRLVVARRNSFRFRGRLVDDSGRSIPRAKVEILWRRSYVSTRTRIRWLGGSSRFELKVTVEPATA